MVRCAPPPVSVAQAELRRASGLLGQHKLSETLAFVNHPRARGEIARQRCGQRHALAPRTKAHKEHADYARREDKVADGTNARKVGHARATIQTIKCCSKQLS
eukprot:5340982-Pleurochrysis_carterae.AAC.2